MAVLGGLSNGLGFSFWFRFEALGFNPWVTHVRGQVTEGHFLVSFMARQFSMFQGIHRFWGSFGEGVYVLLR